ncbi:hypothetical protein V6N13_114132 [Hibiscus sabdariffa]
MSSANQAIDIPKASTTSKRKADHSASTEQTASLNLSTSIDTAELQKLTPTRIQPLRSAKRQRTHPRRKLIIRSNSDKESSKSHAF